MLAAKEKIVKTLFGMCFILLITIPTLFTNFESDKVSEIEQRTLSNFPVFRTEEGINPNYISEFEDWFNDNIGFREQLYLFNVRIQYDVFNTAVNPKVTVGRDGWLFLSGATNVGIADGTYPDMNEDYLKKICQLQILISDKLKEQGREYVLLLPPSKVSVYPEYLKGDFNVESSPVDWVADYLEKNSDVKVVRIKDAIMEEKKASKNRLYCKTDTHWNGYGCYSAYKEIVKELNTWGIVENQPLEAKYSEKSGVRDLMNTMVGKDERYKESVVNAKLVGQKAKRVKNGEKYELLSQYASINNIRRADYYESENEGAPVFLAFGDSMFMDSLGSLVAAHSSAQAAIWDHEIRQYVINIVDPDVVFFEITERNLCYLGEKSRDFAKIKYKRHDNVMDVYYSDFGEYDAMQFPTWSSENGQDDVIWYEATRSDENTWHVALDLTSHPGDGIMETHFYRIIEGADPQVVQTAKFDINLY